MSTVDPTGGAMPPVDGKADGKPSLIKKVQVQVVHPVAHNGVLYPRGVVEIYPQIAAELMALRACSCPNNSPDHPCSGPLLNNVIPFALTQPIIVKTVPTVDATTGAAIDATTHGLNVADSISLIQNTDDANKLKSFMQGERKHPQFRDGRKTVLEAITNQLILLAQ